MEMHDWKEVKERLLNLMRHDLKFASLSAEETRSKIEIWIDKKRDELMRLSQPVRKDGMPPQAVNYAINPPDSVTNLRLN